ncbi:DUF2652 domain-containing protein [Fluviispira vulneris]|uniref:DUF2652 domain-containing protein n=1 Tax=Fluviispira vulneris TaxID=2763012 RepID=UPI001644803A|nr:DUF2652 domain-containing protein [Fluviispira vulneris]
MENNIIQQNEAMLLFADISGYTQFVKKHGFEWAHGQFIISEFLKSLLNEIKDPFKVAKLEGDAIFIYMPETDHIRAAIFMDNILNFFKAFENTKSKLASVNTCKCKSCCSLESLHLKLIIHSGKILFYNINQYQELSGIDVIMLHRLSKNSVTGKKYILITEQAFNKIGSLNDLEFIKGKEKYDEIGEIKTFIHYPNIKLNENLIYVKKPLRILKIFFKIKLLFYTLIKGFN